MVTPALGLGESSLTEARFGHAGGCPSGRGRPIGIAGGGLAVAQRPSEANDSVEIFALVDKMPGTFLGMSGRETTGS